MKRLFTKFHWIYFIAISLFVQNIMGQNGHTLITSVLTTGNQVPPTTGDGVGLITFLFSDDYSEVSVHGAFNNLSGDITSCHIHVGGPDTTGPVVVDLSKMINGNKIKGKFSSANFPFYLFAISNNLYVNVHTAANPNGEIRGQLNLNKEYIFPVIATATDEIPPITTGGIGIGAFRFSNDLTVMDYQFIPSGLTGPPIAAHIHKGGKTENGPVIKALNTGDVIAGRITDFATIISIIAEIIDDNAYMNVHTSANPNGEIRGQLIIDFGLLNGTAIIDGRQEYPTVVTDAIGYGLAVPDFPGLDTLTYFVLTRDINATAAHFHSAAAGKNGPVIFPLIPSGIPGVYYGRAAITPDQYLAFLNDELYINIHTLKNPDGEIRGQVINNMYQSLAFDLCTNQEVPKTKGDGYGAAYVMINKSNSALKYGYITTGMSSPITAHIHEGAFGQNGPVLQALDASTTLVEEELVTTASIATFITNDHAYLNVHTTANNDGEVRGQIRNTLSCVINTRIVESVIHDIRLLSNLVHDQLSIQLISDKSIKAKFYITDLAGNQIMHWSNSNLNSGQNTILKNIENVNAGFYLLKVVDDFQHVNTFKFVKE